MERNKQNFLSFWTVFCPFTSPKDLENENFEKTRKKPGEIIILHMRTINDNHDIWFLRYGAPQTKFAVILDCFLPFYPPNNPKNQNFEKNEKNTWRYHHFTQVKQKL